MKILKRILIVIIAFIALLLVAGLFVKKEYVVEREIIINKPKQEVFDYIKLIKNQDHYNKWVMMDPDMKKTYKGTDGTVGFISAWDSEDDHVGKGEQEIKRIAEGEEINAEVRFIKPFEGIAHTHIITEAVSDTKTKVRWGMEGRNPYPLNLMNLLMDSMLGKDLAASLINLKNVLETK